MVEIILLATAILITVFFVGYSAGFAIHKHWISPEKESFGHKDETNLDNFTDRRHCAVCDSFAHTKYEPAGVCLNLASDAYGQAPDDPYLHFCPSFHHIAASRDEGIDALHEKIQSLTRRLKDQDNEIEGLNEHISDMEVEIEGLQDDLGTAEGNAFG